MTLLPGMRLGHYDVVALIGAGGMGEVYRAHDRKLDRPVAIKVLPAAVARDPERLARFEREAKILASLNHPNIAQLFGIEEDGRWRALVMEFVSGSTLQVPQPLEIALQYAKQVAEALEAAHEKGIVHRDLKPGNIMVTAEGTVKVLDFGLAASLTREVVAESSDSPTLTLAASQSGVILGTAEYMSPEQAAGKAVDKRSDIWSFGVVLYELLTGASMFRGETVSHALAHVLTKAVDLDRLPKDTPPAIFTLLRRCLDRDPRTRLRDIGEARVAIDRCIAGSSSDAAPERRPVYRGPILPWLVAACAIVVAVGLVCLGYREATPVTPALRFEVPVPPKTMVGPFDAMAVSPDGKYVAFCVNRGGSAMSSEVWLRPMDRTEAYAVPGAVNAVFPFWSPNNRFIGFRSPQGLKKAAVDGGPSVLLTTTLPVGGTWSRDGLILIGVADGPIVQISEHGGQEKPVLTLDTSRGETSQTWPQFLPDGRQFLYLSKGGQAPGIYLASLGSQQTRKIADADAQSIYAQGHLLMPGAQQQLIARPFDAGNGRFEGPSFRVADGIWTMPGVSGSVFSVSDAGVLAFRESRSDNSVISIFNRRGEKLGTAGPPGDYAQITLSPDENRIAVDRRENGNYDIWMLELATGVFSRITFDPGNDRDPVFSADGKQIIFTNDRLKMPHLYLKTVGGGAEQLIYRGPDREASEAWLTDGLLLFGNLRGRKYFLLRPADAGQPKAIYESDYTVDEPAVSPDGKWVTYNSDESGRWEAYIARFPQWDERRQISTDGGMQPHWRRDGREVVYVTVDGRLMSVSVRTAPFEASPPVLLFGASRGSLRSAGQVEQWTMSRDASKFYVLTSLGEAETPMTVVLNWLAQARR